MNIIQLSSLEKVLKTTDISDFNEFTTYSA